MMMSSLEEMKALEGGVVALERLLVVLNDCRVKGSFS
jgi:hypothetical protein